MPDTNKKSSSTILIPVFAPAVIVTFLLVVTFTLLQGPTLPRFARWMGVTEAISQHAVTFDSSPLEGIDASLVQVGVPAGSRMAGMYADDPACPVARSSPW